MVLIPRTMGATYPTEELLYVTEMKSYVHIHYFTDLFRTLVE